METFDCQENLRRKLIQPLKETNTIMVECPPSSAKLESIKTSKGQPMAIIKFQVLKTHIEQGVGKNKNFKLYLKDNGTENLLTEKSRINVWEGSHIIVKIFNTKFVAVCSDPVFRMEFDLVPSTVVSVIKDQILVQLAAELKEVIICYLFLVRISDMKIFITNLLDMLRWMMFHSW
jgi:hypothetical protein